MTIKKLRKLLKAFPQDMHIALRAKDDFLLTKDKIYSDKPYFGNCSDGSKLEKKLCDIDEEGDLDYESMPEFLIFDTFRG